MEANSRMTAMPNTKMDIVYIETTVVGNIAGRLHPSPDIPDPNDEILAIQRRLAAKFDNDLHRIAEDIRNRQNEGGREVVSLPPRRCEPKTMPN